MKIVIDHGGLARRARLAHAASLGGLAAILGSVALTMFRPDLATPAALLLVGGFAVATVGTAQANRWVKRPRPEDILDQALKGLSDRHRIYHYRPGLPSHVLLTPSDLLVIETRSSEGVYRLRGGRWSQRMTLGKAVRFFVEEPLGDPLREAQQAAQRLASSLQQSLPGAGGVSARAVVVFTHPAAVVDVDGAPIPVIQPKQLHRHAARTAAPFPAETYAAVRAWLDVGAPPDA